MITPTKLTIIQDGKRINVYTPEEVQQKKYNNFINTFLAKLSIKNS